MLCFGLEPAQAFWPFTHTRASGDSIPSDEWGTRFDAWRGRPVRLAEAPKRPSLEDSLRAVLESQNIQMSPSELARMAALAAQQQKRQTPPAPPSGTPQAPVQPKPDESGSAASGAGTHADADSTGGFQDADPFAAARDTTDVFAGDTAEADSLADDAEAQGGPFSGGPRQPNPAAMSALMGRGVLPTFNSRLTSSNDRMNLNSSLATTVADASGVTLTSSLAYGEVISLTQNTNTENSAINMSLLFPWRRYGLDFNLTTSNARSLRLGRSITNARTRNASDDRGASITGQGAREFVDGVRGNAFYARRLTQNEQQIEATAGTSSGDRANEITGSSFGFGGNVDRVRWIVVRGRYGQASSNNLDRSASFVSDFNPSGEQHSTSEGDTAQVSVSVPRAGWLSNLQLDFQNQKSEESFTDVTRTASGGVANDTEFALETRRNHSRSINMRGSLVPWSPLSTQLTFAARRDSVSYRLRPNQFRDDLRVDWSIATTWTYMTGSTLRVAYDAERSETDQNEPSNPRNPQTREEKSRNLSVSVNHGFTPSFKVRAYGDIGLKQGFYRHAGPQGLGDRDDLRTRVGLDVDGRISSKATARVQMYVRTFDQAFIDNRRSSRSRNETEYVVRPGFTYNITNDLVVEQFYGLSSKVLDEVYNPSRNTLNRNHFLQTTMRYKMTSRLELETRWEYLLQDNGFYIDNPFTLQEDRVFAPSARTKKDEVKLSMRYALVRDGVLTFTSENVATREHTGIASTVVNERGNLALGLDSRIQVGTLSLNARASRNQSFNVTLNRNVFYNVDSSLSYAF